MNFVFKKVDLSKNIVPKQDVSYKGIIL